MSRQRTENAPDLNRAAAALERATEESRTLRAENEELRQQVDYLSRQPVDRRIPANAFDGPVDEEEEAMYREELRSRAQAGGGARPANTSARARPVAEGDTKRWGWKHAGEFFAGVIEAGRRGVVDPRLVRGPNVNAAASDWGSEGVGEDGGFAVPPEFTSEIMMLVDTPEALEPRCTPYTVGRNIYIIPADARPVWNTTGGIRAFWEDEGDAGQQTKPKLEDKTAKLKKLMCLVNMSNEVLDDAPALDSYIRATAPAVIEWKRSDAVMNGNGAGQPLGILNSPALISVTRQSGTTLVFDDIANLMKRMYSPCFARAIWIITPDLQPDLLKVNHPSDSRPVYLPNNNISGAPFGTLLGRPVIFHEVSQTAGAKGDIVLADLTKYASVKKTGGMRTDVSLHLYFDQDLMAFRFILRVDGMPLWAAPITPANSSTTRSCFVTLAA